MDTTCFSSSTKTDAVAMKSPGFSQTTWCRGAVVPWNPARIRVKPAPAYVAIIQPWLLIAISSSRVLVFLAFVGHLSVTRSMTGRGQKGENAFSLIISRDTAIKTKMNKDNYKTSRPACVTGSFKFRSRWREDHFQCFRNKILSKLFHISFSEYVTSAMFSDLITGRVVVKDV